MLDRAWARDNVDDSSDQATGFVSMIMLNRDDGVAVESG